MTQKKKIRVSKKSTRRDHQKKARSPKAMALSAREAVKKQALESITTPSRTKPVPNMAHAHVNGNGAAKPVNNHTDPASSTAEVSPAVGTPSLFASQMDAFARLLKWTPFGMILQQQSILAGMMFNMHYPNRSRHNALRELPV
jgi:hypothetical protein